LPSEKDISSFNLWQTINVRSLEHKREIKKKTRSGDNKIRRVLKAASKVRSLLSDFATRLTTANRNENVKT
jgi:protein SDA1